MECAFPTAEHWMMTGNARLFKGQEILAKILVAKHPQQAKKLGRKVCNFDQKIWEANLYAIVLKGNVAKFEQHEFEKYQRFDYSRSESL